MSATPTLINTNRNSKQFFVIRPTWTDTDLSALQAAWAKRGLRIWIEFLNWSQAYQGFQLIEIKCELTAVGQAIADPALFEQYRQSVIKEVSAIVQIHPLTRGRVDSVDAADKTHRIELTLKPTKPGLTDEMVQGMSLSLADLITESIFALEAPTAVPADE